MHTDGSIFTLSAAAGSIFEVVDITEENYQKEYQQGLYFFNDYVPEYGIKSLRFSYYRPSGNLIESRDIGINYIQKGDQGEQGKPGTDAISINVDVATINYTLRPNGKANYQSFAVTFTAFKGDEEQQITSITPTEGNAAGVTATVAKNVMTVVSIYNGTAPAGYIICNVVIDGKTYTKTITITSAQNNNYLGPVTRWNTGIDYKAGDLVYYAEYVHVYRCLADHTSTTAITPEQTTYWQDATELGCYISWAGTTLLTQFTQGLTYDYSCTDADTYSWNEFDSLKANLAAFDDIMDVIADSDDETIPSIKMVKKLAALTVLTKNLIVQNVNLKSDGYIQTESFIDMNNVYFTDVQVSSYSAHGTFVLVKTTITVDEEITVPEDSNLEIEIAIQKEVSKTEQGTYLKINGSTFYQNNIALEPGVYKLTYYYLPKHWSLSTTKESDIGSGFKIDADGNIQSSNYTNKTGYKLTSDGKAYFNELEISGYAKETEIETIQKDVENANTTAENANSTAEAATKETHTIYYCISQTDVTTQPETPAAPTEWITSTAENLISAWSTKRNKNTSTSSDPDTAPKRKWYYECIQTKDANGNITCSIVTMDVLALQLWAMTEGRTIIKNGYIQTNFIKVDELFAQSIELYAENGYMQSSSFRTSEGTEGFYIGYDGTTIFNNSTFRGRIEAEHGLQEHLLSLDYDYTTVYDDLYEGIKDIREFGSIQARGYLYVKANGFHANPGDILSIHTSVSEAVIAFNCVSSSHNKFTIYVDFVQDRIAVNEGAFELREFFPSNDYPYTDIATSDYFSMTGWLQY